MYFYLDLPCYPILYGHFRDTVSKGGDAMNDHKGMVPSGSEDERGLFDKSIAVLPFVNMSSSEETEYFSDGMTEEIINALAKIKGLKVTSRTSSFYFKGKNIPIPQIGEELGVSTILEGSVRLSGSKMRITAQLIDVSEDFHFWSETFDRTLEDVFAVQDEVSLLIADKLREHLGHFEIGEKLVDTPDIPVEIYKLYLKGRYHLMKLNVPGTEKAITIFDEVISAQPNFPLAYLSVNQGYAFLGTMGLLPAAEAFTKAQPYLAKAIELDENLPECQLNLAWIACWQNWDLEGAYRHLTNGMEVRQTDDMMITMANFLTVEGKLDVAMNYINKALQLDPFLAMNHHYKGFLLYLQEKYDHAFPYLAKSLSYKPDLPFPPLIWGECLVLSGRAEEGLKYFEDLPEGVAGDLTKLGGSTLAYAAMGKLEKVEEGIEELEVALQTDSMGSAMNFLILCQTMVGQYEEALKLIEQGIEYRLPAMMLLNTEPILKPLRSNPRFKELMHQIFGDRASYSSPERKYKKALLNADLQTKYRQQLEALMEEEKPYLNPKLTLRGLAMMMDIPPNHLSQLLNEGFDKNFSEYVNTYRLETFKSKVIDPAHRHLTILGLAFDSGFNSKTVFNTFFKKMEGKTPKAYWKSVVK